jgi:hypothetical protein
MGARVLARTAGGSIELRAAEMGRSRRFGLLRLRQLTEIDYEPYAL